MSTEIPNEEPITKESINERAINCLKNVYDPEIPVNIYDLGLIYGIDIDDDMNLKVTMTMTAPNCPESEFMVEEVKRTLGYITGVKSVEVSLTFDPPWSIQNLSEEAKLELGYL